MRNKLQLLLFALILVSLSNCTVTKRNFHPGYHVTWNKNLHSDDDPKEERISPTITENIKKSTDRTELEVKQMKPVEELIASTDESSVETAFESVSDFVRTSDQKIGIEIPDKRKTSQIIEREKEKNPKEKNERRIPLWLGIFTVIMTSWLVLLVGLGLLFLFITSMGMAGYFVGGLFTLVFLYLCIRVYFNLFSRDKTKFESDEVRDKKYLRYSIIIALPFVAFLMAIAATAVE